MLSDLVVIRTKVAWRYCFIVPRSVGNYQNHLCYLTVARGTWIENEQSEEGVLEVVDSWRMNEWLRVAS